MFFYSYRADLEDFDPIAAGGISSYEYSVRLQALGAAAVQLGTAFAVTAESNAAPEFKRILAEAKPKDMVGFVSVAGLPARRRCRSLPGDFSLIWSREG